MKGVKLKVVLDKSAACKMYITKNSIAEIIIWVYNSCISDKKLFRSFLKEKKKVNCSGI